jgi:hypothetical protein
MVAILERFGVCDAVVELLQQHVAAGRPLTRSGIYVPGVCVQLSQLCKPEHLLQLFQGRLSLTCAVGWLLGAEALPWGPSTGVWASLGSVPLRVGEDSASISLSFVGEWRGAAHGRRVWWRGLAGTAVVGGWWHVACACWVVW